MSSLPTFLFTLNVSLSAFATEPGVRKGCAALAPSSPTVARLYPELPADILAAFVWASTDEPDTARAHYRLAHSINERLQHRLSLGLWLDPNRAERSIRMNIGVTLDSRRQRDEFRLRVHPLGFEVLLDYLNDRRVYLHCKSPHDIELGISFLRSLIASSSAGRPDAHPSATELLDGV